MTTATSNILGDITKSPFVDKLCDNCSMQLICEARGENQGEAWIYSDQFAYCHEIENKPSYRDDGKWIDDANELLTGERS